MALKSYSAICVCELWTHSKKILLATSENLYFSKNGMLKNRVTMLFVFLKWGFRRLPVVIYGFGFIK